MNEKNSVRKTFKYNDAALEFIALSENVISCLHWRDFNSVDIIFPNCASFYRTNEDDEKRGKFHRLTILYRIYTVGQKKYFRRKNISIVLDD